MRRSSRRQRLQPRPDRKTSHLRREMSDLKSTVRALSSGMLRVSLMCLLVSGTALRGQEPAARPAQPQPVPLPTQEEGQKSPQASCVEPAPMVRWQDYKGPFSRTVGTFAGRLERKSVHAPHPPQYKPGTLLCSFAAKRKFVLFVEDTTDPVTFLSAAFNAAINGAEDADPTFGHGAAGYGDRFGAALADDASSVFFKDFAYPSLFSEDPRYYRLAHGSGGRRFAHALEHVVVAHGENGTYRFNFSEWLGTTSAVALADVYHPGNKPGIAPAARNVALAVSQDMGFDVLREFWPEVARKFKLRFRGQQEPN